jgi:hypothetical protein
MTRETVAFSALESRIRPQFGRRHPSVWLGASQKQAIVEEMPLCGPIAEYCEAELRRDC